MTQHVQKKCELLLMWNQNYSMWKDQSWKIINPKWLVIMGDKWKTCHDTCKMFTNT